MRTSSDKINSYDEKQCDDMRELKMFQEQDVKPIMIVILHRFVTVPNHKKKRLKKIV